MKSRGPRTDPCGTPFTRFISGANFSNLLTSYKIRGFTWKDIAVAGVVAGAAGAVVAPTVLTVAGFTSAGVAAGSVAAIAQSTFYGGYVTSGSWFALAQSAGAAGIGGKFAAAIGAAVGGATLALRKKLRE